MKEPRAPLGVPNILTLPPLLAAAKAPAPTASRLAITTSTAVSSSVRLRPCPATAARAALLACTIPSYPLLTGPARPYRLERSSHPRPGRRNHGLGGRD